MTFNQIMMEIFSSNNRRQKSADELIFPISVLHL